MKSTLSILSTAIIVAILSYSKSSLGQDYFHVNGDDISENSASFTDLQVTKDKIPDSSVRFSGVGLSGNKEITFLGQYTNVIISNQETEETAGIVLNNGATAYFNADNTVIDVKSVGSSGKWGFGLLVNGLNGSKAVFNGKNVTIKKLPGSLYFTNSNGQRRI